MEPQRIRKTFKYRLKPKPTQERALEAVLWRCRTLYNVALEQRKTWWGRGQGISATYYQQAGELPDLKTICPEYAQVHSQVLQDVLRRVDKTYQAFFRRIQAGKRVVTVPAYYTSQDCSGCGERVPKSLSVRTHICPCCGLVLDRDENAALNILRAGQARQGAAAVAAVMN